jgi:hypothetical protein
MTKAFDARYASRSSGPLCVSQRMLGMTVPTGIGICDLIARSGDDRSDRKRRADRGYDRGLAVHTGEGRKHPARADVLAPYMDLAFVEGAPASREYRRRIRAAHGAVGRKADFDLARPRFGEEQGDGEHVARIVDVFDRRKAHFA